MFRHNFAININIIKMKFDDIIIELGEFGRYQRRSYFLIGLVGIATAAHMLAQVSSNI